MSEVSKRVTVVSGKGRVKVAGQVHVPADKPVTDRHRPKPPEDKRPPVGTLIARFPASCRGARHVFGGNVVLTFLVEETAKYDALPVTDFRDAVYEIEVRIANARVANLPRRERNLWHETERKQADEGGR